MSTSTTVVNFLKQEPVRAYGYSVAAAVLALLVYLSVISAGALPIFLTVIGVVLSVGGTETVRSSVSPVAPKVPTAPDVKM